MYFAGKHLNAARYAAFGAAWHLDIPTRSPSAIRRAKAALKGRRRLAPEFEHDPTPWEAAVAICARLAPQGRP
eukprot:4989984-Lingulodinium_polyedra.AAC.1